ncbi:hypothetical protein [Glaciihabitans sp. UYNi722]|uniref:hypothetical protein n=1 Tax=Glaciihabitans sp. UYNi722 TaxID=3156344 RepID=UPI00339620AF
MLYPTPPGDSVQPIVDHLKETRRQLREAQRPSGTNLGSLVAQVQAALANINSTVATAIAANSYTRAQTDSKVATPGAISPTTVNASGIVTADAGISSLDARNTTVITNRTALWIDGAGRMGNSSSSVFVKQDFAPADAAAKVNALLHLGLLDFRRIDAVEELGESAPVELGSIVEYVAGTPLEGMTFNDAQGKPQGINWADMIPTMIATMQSMHARIVELENPTA